MSRVMVIHAQDNTTNNTTGDFFNVKGLKRKLFVALNDVGDISDV